MDPFHFACPHCSSRLRVREKLYVGRQVACPECGRTVLIVERSQGLGVERVDQNPGAPTGPDRKRKAAKKGVPAVQPQGAAAADSRAASGRPPGAASKGAARPAQRGLRAFFQRRSALIVAGAAAALAAGILAIVFPPRSSDTAPAIDESPADMAIAAPDLPAANDLDGTSKPRQEMDDLPFLAAASDERSGDLRMTDDGEALPQTVSSAQAQMEESNPDDRPIEPEFADEQAAPPVRKIDLAASLKQPIARFDQPKSKPLEEVLTSVAEMAGARIAFDRDELGPAAAKLAEPMALKLENTTVGDILSGLLRPAGLGFRIEGDHLRLVHGE